MNRRRAQRELPNTRMDPIRIIGRPSGYGSGIMNSPTTMIVLPNPSISHRQIGFSVATAVSIKDGSPEGLDAGRLFSVSL